MKGLDGKVALVTGAASGIGRATAVRLASEGAEVICADRNLDGAMGTAGSLKNHSAAFGFDAADAASCEALIGKAQKWRGRLDVLCNVAGIGGFGHTEQIGEATWRALIDINLSGVFHLTKFALPHLTATKGNIVNVASAAGLVGTAYASAYAASKHGVVGFTKAVAIEYASRGVRVNAVCPGAVDTPLIAGGFTAIEGVEWPLVERMTPKLGPVAQPEDIAAAIAFLASDDASFITGAMLAVDGGQTAG
ncbi:MAG: SDR family oxidoreductase [Proteobacteria bacterium]|nr:SDR family oxidoreductase [Pseudomonadota bacterium]